MLRLHRRASVGLIWALVPLLVWSGLPHAICLCADGHSKLFCAHRTSAADQPVQAAPKHSCCQKHATHTQTATAIARGCCRSMVSTPVLPPSEKPQLPPTAKTVAWLSARPGELEPPADTTAARLPERIDPLLEFDRVIAHCTLLI